MNTHVDEGNISEPARGLFACSLYVSLGVIPGPLEIVSTIPFFFPGGESPQLSLAFQGVLSSGG